MCGKPLLAFSMLSDVDFEKRVRPELFVVRSPLSVTESGDRATVDGAITPGFGPERNDRAK
jgi:hypothetical protein